MGFKVTDLKYLKYLLIYSDRSKLLGTLTYGVKFGIDNKMKVTNLKYQSDRS